MNNIQRRSAQESQNHAALARDAVAAAIAAAAGELAGLRSRLDFYPQPAARNREARRLVEEFVLGSPGKYAEIGLADLPAGRVTAIHTVGEFQGTYPVTSTREENPSRDCPPGPPCILGLSSGPHEGLVRIIVPAVRPGGTMLVAFLHLHTLLDAIAAVAAPPGVTTAALDPSGLIVWAEDVALLRTFAPNSAPHLTPPASRAARRDGRAMWWESIAQPRLVLAVAKDEREELAELRTGLWRIAWFAALLTALALAGVWALTGRMAASLRHVADVAGGVEAGNLSRRISLHRTDELGQLIDSFNGMMGKLEASYRELHDVNAELERKVAELTRTRRRLSEKERLALVGEALSRISHEIQNKIGGVGVWVQNLERYGVRDENTGMCIREMKSALDSFLDMLVHFKRFYRTPVLHKDRVTAAELVRSSLDRVGAELQVKDLTVEQDLGPEPVPLDADRAQLTDAMVNILLNAAYFSPEHGQIRIGLRRLNGDVVFSFRDRGPGLPAKAKLFRPFFTTRPSGGGLGLAIVRNIVHAHGGRVRAYNNAEGGACFEMRLPAGSAV